jgi:hypothetical protein
LRPKARSSSAIWLALLAGAIAVVIAAAELSGADDPSGLTIGLWSVVAVLGFGYALWEHFANRPAPDGAGSGRPRVKGRVRLRTAEGDAAGVEADRISDADVEGEARWIGRLPRSALARGLRRSVSRGSRLRRRSGLDHGRMECRGLGRGHQGCRRGRITSFICQEGR